MKNTRILRLFLAIGICVLSSGVSLAGNFSLQIIATTTNFSLGATTTPPGRLAWMRGDSPNDITKLIELESLPLAQHDYLLNFPVLRHFIVRHLSTQTW